MTDQPVRPSIFDPALVAQLACPACHADLRLSETHLMCTGCARAYPIVGGIPVLIVDRAEKIG